MEVTSAGGSASAFVDASKTGFNGLTPDDFMRMLITELQNQDPTEPLGNEQLLNQLSTMRNLAANIELSESLQAITSNQQLTSAANFIGKTVSGSNANQVEITGVVDRAFIRDGNAFVSIGEQELPLSNVTTVTGS